MLLSALESLAGLSTNERRIETLLEELNTFAPFDEKQTISILVAIYRWIYHSNRSDYRPVTKLSEAVATKYPNVVAQLARLSEIKSTCRVDVAECQYVTPAPTSSPTTSTQLIDSSDIFNSLVKLSDWAYRQGESRLKSGSGADQSESELYIEESRFWQRVAAGCPVSMALSLSETYWRAYCDEIQQRIASAPKISHRGHPREGQSVIEHRYVDVEMWSYRVRNVIEPWLSRVFVGVDANEFPRLAYFSHPTYNELDRVAKPSIRYFARYRVEREKRERGDATKHDSMRYSLLFGPFREYRTVIDLINNLVAGTPARPRYGQDIVACSIDASIVKRYTLRGRLNQHPDYNDLYRNAFLEESRA